MDLSVQNNDMQWVKFSKKRIQLIHIAMEFYQGITQSNTKL